ncbi:hypothetical protein POJ06DRAFT_260097 [Lipomyces tetrasporus]|uniref:Pre-mRNA-splicing factor 18 n=1 Tax=Lipomyces tetrasporus TaxID=54092 RepID=A0AAD7QM61_9ASCO|nr:uncharacterized protein POJ06DRAFT_260097 [Lipomyces tetrasporus]KAJ8097789.1 hypothetical protein POJ06DRAFT_260097 [Lipomyces tetrasporus]
MDFSALLAKEIAKKKEAATVTASKNENGASHKPAGSDTPRFIRRGDVEHAREQAYLAEKAKREEDKRLEHEKRRREQQDEDGRRERKRREAEQKYLEKKRAREEQEEFEKQKKLKNKNRANTKSPTPDAREGTADAEELAKLTELTEEDMLVRLRKLREPARYFGESDKSRLRRLRRAERRAETSDEVIEELLATINHNIVGQDVKTDRPKVYLQLEKYFRYLLKEWERVLVTRDDTPDQAFETLSQTKGYLQPLFEQLRKKNLHEQIYPSLATLMIYLQQRKYRDANDTYLKLSIGNAAWPIGVTAVGIHERSARERITGQDVDGKLGKSSVQIAHVMSDEKTRKWLTAVKRLITFSESQWPED